MTQSCGRELISILFKIIMITTEEFESIIATGENVRIEFKLATIAFPSSAYETIVSFSNKDGGVIVLGVDDDRELVGISPLYIEKIKGEVISSCNSTSLINPSIFPSIAEFKYKNKLYLIIKVAVSSQVHKLKNVIYEREGGIDLRVTDPAKIEEVYFRKRQVFTENQIFPYLTMEDLDVNLFEKARKIIYASKPSHPWLSLNNEELLRSASLHTKDFTTGQTGLTLAAALIFGRDSTINNVLPSYKVEAMVRVVDQDRWDDRITLRTNLIDTYQQLMEFIMNQKSLPDKFHLENDQRIDLRYLIFREVIGNIIVHREYTNNIATEVLILPNKVYATNPNRVHYRGPLDVNTFSPYAKNPNIRKFFTAFGWTDEIGSGIRNVTKFMRIYVPGAFPRFHEDDVFKTEIPIVVKSFASTIELLFRLLRISEKAKGYILGNISSLSLNDQIDSPTIQQTVQNLIMAWHNTAKPITVLNWPKTAFVVSEHSASETDIFIEPHKKVIILMQILLLAIKPMGIDVMMTLMDYESRTSFRDQYIKPLLEVGFLLRTIPDKPNSPNQKYRTSEMGKLFVSG
jgi:ATP-dependent DNA helicase RecG